MWPWGTGTRVTATCIRISPPTRRRVSAAIFSSSPAIQGITFPAIASAPGPERPAPERAWSVATVTDSTPHVLCRGARTGASPETTQLGLVTKAPPARRQR